MFIVFSAALSWWDLDVGNLSEALEEAAKLILSDVSGKTSNEDRGVVWVGKLVHWLWGTIVSDSWSTLHGEHAWSHVAAHSATWHSAHAASSWSTTAGLVLWCCSRDAHWTVAAVDTLHLSEGTLLIALIGEANKAVATRHARDWVRHNLSRLTRWEARLEEADEDDEDEEAPSKGLFRKKK